MVNTMLMYFTTIKQTEERYFHTYFPTDFQKGKLSCLCGPPWSNTIPFQKWGSVPPENRGALHPGAHRQLSSKAVVHIDRALQWGLWKSPAKNEFSPTSQTLSDEIISSQNSFFFFIERCPLKTSDSLVAFVTRIDSGLRIWVLQSLWKIPIYVKVWKPLLNRRERYYFVSVKLKRVVLSQLSLVFQNRFFERIHIFLRFPLVLSMKGENAHPVSIKWLFRVMFYLHIPYFSEPED